MRVYFTRYAGEWDEWKLIQKFYMLLTPTFESVAVIRLIFGTAILSHCRGSPRLFTSYNRDLINYLRIHVR